MRLFVVLLCILFFLTASSQNQPIVSACTTTQVLGTAENNTTVHIDTDNDGNANFNINVTNGTFRQAFVPPLTAGQYIVVWGENASHINTPRIAYTIITDAQALQNHLSLVPSSNNLKELDAADPSRPDVRDTYKTSIWNTVFSVPIVRANQSRNEPLTEAHVSLFSSVGAGFGYSLGRLEVVRNHDGKVTNEEFFNRIGLHIGILYSSATGEETTNVIAGVLNLSILDVQIGAGYEAGTITPNQKRIFFTFSYAIPLYRLTKVNHGVRLRTPLPIKSERT